ncbi:MAG: PilZ domain-containing protein [Candidatus Sumerlaeia bacterium]
MANGIRTFREKRRFERYPCSFKMTFTILSSADSTPYEYGVAHSTNLSASGVCIFSEQKINVPILMQLNISLPVRPFHLLILAKAVRCIAEEDSSLYEIGLKFVGILPPEFKQLVTDLSPDEEDSQDSQLSESEG